MNSVGDPIQYATKTTNSLAKDLTVFVGLVVDGPLDIGILKDAAGALVARWPILGGELVTKTTPYSLKTGNTVDFLSRTINKSFHDYFPLNTQTQETAVPTYREQLPGNASDKLFHFDSLRHLNLLPRNLLTIRVSVLEDATLLGFRVPHHFCDGESVYAIVKAYCATIAGEKVASLVMPPDVDRPLSSVLKEDTGITLPTGMGTEGVPYLYPNENLCLGFGPWIRYVGYAVSRMVGSKLGIFPKSREQFIHLPGKLVAHWRDECQKELEQLMASDDGQEVPNPSKLDAITAWFLQTSLRETPPDDGPIDLMYNFSYRFALPPPEANTLYLKNSYYELRVHWDSLASFQKSSLAQLAVNVRSTVLRNKQSPIIKANLEFQEKHVTELVAPGARGTRLAFLPFVSSWTTFEYNGMNFSGALLKDENDDPKQSNSGRRCTEKLGTGKVGFVQPWVALPMGITVDPLAIVLKDGKGGYWIRANLSKNKWKGHGQ